MKFGQEKGLRMAGRYGAAIRAVFRHCHRLKGVKDCPGTLLKWEDLR